MAKWYGIDNVEFIWHGEWADSELRYRGISFTEWMITDALWSEFLEGNEKFTDNDAWTEPAETEFAEFLKDRAEWYLEDVIWGMAPKFFEMMPWTNSIMEEVVAKEKLEFSTLEYLAEKGRRDVLDAIYKYAEHPYEYELSVFGAWDEWLDAKEYHEIEDEDAEVFDDTGLDMTIVVWK